MIISVHNIHTDQPSSGKATKLIWIVFQISNYELNRHQTERSSRIRTVIDLQQTFHGHAISQFCYKCSKNVQSTLIKNQCQSEESGWGSIFPLFTSCRLCACSGKTPGSVVTSGDMRRPWYPWYQSIGADTGYWPPRATCPGCCWEAAKKLMLTTAQIWTEIFRYLDAHCWWPICIGRIYSM